MEGAVGLAATGKGVSSAVNSGHADTWQMWVVYTFSASPRRESGTPTPETRRQEESTQEDKDRATDAIGRPPRKSWP